MRIGALRIKLHLPQSFSLKEKRRVIRSIEGKLRNGFNVAISEVDDKELWQVSTIGVVCICDSGREARETLERVLRYIEGRRGEVEVLDYEIEVIPF